MASPPTQKEWIISLLEPLYLLVFGYYHMLLYLLSAVLLHGDLAIFFSPNRLRRESFGPQWIALNRVAPATNADAPDENQVEFKKIFSHVSGRVLEIGPGSGVQVQYFTPYASKITAIYGAEPVPALHASLRRSAADAGLGDKYRILPCGSEAASLVPGLAREGLLGGGDDSSGAEDGVFDTIVSLRVLCSVPEQEETVDMLYRLLKPGGKMLVYEHLRNRQGGVAAALQRLYMAAGWSFVWGDCTMLRDTIDTIRGAAREDGVWQEAQISVQNDWGCIPFGVGVFTKRA
ncbi:MAG: hypothetical protein M1814_000399 [Vezdaea aestivalis]|nr:MAG: hypothetical protein M1814_000399 [Vezdaea aestivalis]